MRLNGGIHAPAMTATIMVLPREGERHEVQHQTAVL